MSKSTNMFESAAACCPSLSELLTPKLFKALGDPTRVGILARLAESCGSCTVGRIAEGLPVDFSVVSRHLAVLRDAGIVEAERRGKEVHYQVRYQSLVSCLRQLADAIEACCPAPKVDEAQVEGQREDKNE